MVIPGLVGYREPLSFKRFLAMEIFLDLGENFGIQDDRSRRIMVPQTRNHNLKLAE